MMLMYPFVVNTSVRPLIVDTKPWWRGIARPENRLVASFARNWPNLLESNFTEQ